MKNQRISFLLITLFLLFCLIPSLGMLVLGPSPLLANESASRTPALRNRDGSFNTELLSDTSDYIGTRFALRPYLVSARSFLYEKLLHSSAEDQVTLGENGELYYSSTLDDYAGLGLTDTELEQIAQHLRDIQDAAEASGSRFLFTVAPNKNTIVPEGMPARFPAGHDSSNYARLLPLLEKHGVHFVDLTTALTEQPELYYRTDSHWTAEGAAIAADALLCALDRESGYGAGPFASEGTHIGDLYQMLYPTGKGRESETVYVPGFTHQTESDPRGGNAMTILTNSSSGTGTLYCRRDSFGIALYPYLADAFAEAEFSRSADYSVSAFSAIETDAVILEIVERNLPLLLPTEDSAA